MTGCGALALGGAATSVARADIEFLASAPSVHAAKASPPVDGGPPADVPGASSPVETPRDAPPADVPGASPPVESPRDAPPADVPRGGPPADVPRGGPPADVPGASPPVETPRGGPPAATPAPAPPAVGLVGPSGQTPSPGAGWSGAAPGGGTPVGSAPGASGMAAPSLGGGWRAPTAGRGQSLAPWLGGGSAASERGGAPLRGSGGVFTEASALAAEGAVAGARTSGGNQGGPAGSEDEGRPTAAGPLLGTPFGDVEWSPINPLFVILLVMMVASVAWIGREVMRAVR